MITLSGLSVVELDLVQPLIGPWHASLVLSADAAPEEPLVLSDEKTDFECTLVRGGFQGARYVATVVGGAGKLATVLEAAHYRTTKVRLIFEEIVRGAGETVCPESDGATLERELPAWSRARASAGTALSELADELGVSWRVLADGTVWLGPDTFPELDEPIEEPTLKPSPVDGSRSIATEFLTLRPGVTHDGERVKRVVHSVANGTLRTRYWVV